MSIDRSKINRRDYIKYAFLVAAGLAGSAGIFWRFSRKDSTKQIITPKAENIEATEIETTTVTSDIENEMTTASIMENKPIVSMVRGNSETETEAMVRKSVDAIGGIEQIVSSGDKVVVKPPVLTSDNDCAPDARVVAAVAKLTIEAGGDVMVAESSGNGNTAYNMSKVGITSAAEEVGAQVKDLQTEKEVEIPVPDGLALHQVKTFPTIKNCDVLISVPRLKRHASATVTISLKNMMGILPRSEMRRFHQTNLSQCIADLNTVIKPELTVVDATYAMTQRGPTGGDMKKLDTIIASKDPVASDLIAAQELQKLEERTGVPLGFAFKADSIKHMNAAAELGVGSNNPQDIQITEIFS